MTQLSPYLKGYLLAGFGALCAAMFFIPYKKALQTTAPEVYILAIYIAGFVFNLGASTLKKEAFRITKATFYGAIAFALLSVVGNYAIGKAMAGIDPAVTIVIARTQIIMVMIMGWLLLRERLHFLLIPGVIIAFIGFFIMSYDPNATVGGELSFYLWAIASAFCFGASQIMTKAIIHKIAPITLNHLRLLFGGIIIACSPGVFSAVLQLDLEIWVLAATSALFGPTLSRVSYMYAVRYIPVTQSILFTMLTPFFALLLAWLTLGIFPSQREILGGSIMIIGIFIPITHLVLTAHKKTKDTKKLCQDTKIMKE